MFTEISVYLLNEVFLYKNKTLGNFRVYVSFCHNIYSVMCVIAVRLKFINLLISRIAYKTNCFTFGYYLEVHNE